MNNQGEQRESQIIADSLEGIFSGSTSVESVIRYQPELAKEIINEYSAAMWLIARQKQVDPPPDFVPNSKVRLMKRIQSEAVQKSMLHPVQPVRAATSGVPTNGGRPSYTYRKPAQIHVERSQPVRPAARQPLFRFGTAVALLLILIFSFTGTAFASYSSQDALPGDTLYTVKLITEDVRMTMTFTPEAKTNLSLIFAERRLGEAETLIERGQYAQALPALAGYRQEVAETVRYSRQAQEGGNKAQFAGVVGKVESALKTQNEKLSLLLNEAPAAQPDVIKKALQSSKEASEYAKEAVAAMGHQPGSGDTSGEDTATQPTSSNGQEESSEQTSDNGNNNGNNNGNDQGQPGSPTQKIDQGNNDPSGKNAGGKSETQSPGNGNNNSTKVTPTPKSQQPGNQVETPVLPDKGNSGGQKPPEPQPTKKH